MKRANLWLLLVCLACIAGLLMLATMRKVAQNVSPPAGEPQKVGPQAAMPPSPDRPAVLPPPVGAGTDFTGHPDALAFGTEAIPPEREAMVLMNFLQAYRREFGAFPTGNENTHFVNALAGANPDSLVIFPIRHPRVSPAGELLDAWGRPFHFHPITRHHLEVRSAGADGELFTGDDLVAPSPAERADQ